MVKSVTEMKGLKHLRTAISTHTRSTSRHKGTPYLEILSLGMEKLRLKTELSHLNERVARLESRLEEIGGVLGERLAMVAEETPAAPGPRAVSGTGGRPAGTNMKAPRGFKTMKVEY